MGTKKYGLLFSRPMRIVAARFFYNFIFGLAVYRLIFGTLASTSFQKTEIPTNRVQLGTKRLGKSLLNMSRSKKRFKISWFLAKKKKVTQKFWIGVTPQPPLPPGKTSKSKQTKVPRTIWIWV